MTHSNDKRTLIEIIAPALRGLAGEGDWLPRVRYTREDSASGALEFNPAEGAEEGAIIDALRAAWEAVQGEDKIVAVPGVGKFHIERGTKPEGRMAGRVAMVTGAAQGFGLEIAQHLAAQGAYVVLTDMNADGVARAATDIEMQYGTGRGTGLLINVTDGASIAEAVYQTVCLHGGLDLLVANAGVVKAGSVKQQPVKDFEFVTAVNYTGYFLCVQNVAPIMARQNRAKPGRWADIIQINSKSGLTGSNKNGAYAGSKFGGIGLTQSFALELVEDGIKVNSICPGNFLDGPLWSDPEKGLFVQYLKSGKVPGAKTVEDVKRSYTSKVPMNRGCTTADVMNAVYYIVDQKYETGQAIPVTGGQVMLG